ncbi:MAG TPA: hypothetical protein VHO69_04195 [Phototrophicaceae bacterium]|nr:hypothetical protein [Phototrophicaceae bacterium]
MSKQKMLAAKELIQEKRYDEARTILKTVNHPTAKQWLEKLDKIAPVKPKSARPNRRILLLVLLPLCIVLMILTQPNKEGNQNTPNTVSPKQTTEQKVGNASTPQPTLPPAMTQKPSVTPTITETSVPTLTPAPTNTPTLIPTIAPIRYDSNSLGLQPVIGPVQLRSGIYRAKVVTNGFFIGKVETLQGTCDTGWVGLFNLSSGQANMGASSLLKSQDCEALIAISNTTDTWSLEFEQISPEINTYLTIPLQFDSSVEGLMPILGPFKIPSGTYRVTVNTNGFFSASLETLNGNCDAGFMGLFNLSQGQASAGASNILKSKDCAALIVISNVTEPWTLKFEPVSR